jgi:hypothetical protein
MTLPSKPHRIDKDEQNHEKPGHPTRKTGLLSVPRSRIPKNNPLCLINDMVNASCGHFFIGSIHSQQSFA